MRKRKIYIDPGHRCQAFFKDFQSYQIISYLSVYLITYFDKHIQYSLDSNTEYNIDLFKISNMMKLKHH